MEITRAGGTVHYPAILCYDKRGVRGPAILGFKTREAYKALLVERLVDVSTRETLTGQAFRHWTQDPDLSTRGGSVHDIEIDGRPGAYFRYIPGGNFLGFQSQRRNYILDKEDGVRYAAPGFVDLVPTPDGRYLVTPSRRRGGLVFYAVDDVVPHWYEVFARWLPTAAPQAANFTPIYVDPEMQDQYPSVGILKEGDNASTYRVLTSWFDGIMYRDYDVRHAAMSASTTIRPWNEPVQACPGYQLSTPIISKDGTELAARDEVTATTKILHINDDASCDEVLDIGMQTGKVAWDSTGRRIAFAVPRGVMRDGSEIVGVGFEHVGGLQGIFVLDRGTLTLTRVPGSDDVDRLTFPEFIDDNTVAFVVRGGRVSGQRDRFRFFCCLN